MLNGKFENHGEIFKFLLDGGVITNLDDSCECYVELRNGKLMFNTETEETEDPDEKAGALHFETASDWRPYSQVRLLNKIKRLEAENAALLTRFAGTSQDNTVRK
jgi:hypothetical protein